jgi:putative addiction module component (TIGR02574 family)
MDAARILDELMALPPDERREIALRALESVEETVDPDHEAKWLAELHRRSEAIESGAEPTFSHEEAMDFIVAPLRKKTG